MNDARTGVVLAARDFPGCAAFHAEIPGLPIMLRPGNGHSTPTCYDMGAGVYLMIEPRGPDALEGGPSGKNAMWLRYNVEDVEAAAR